MEPPPNNLKFSRAGVKDALALSLLADFSFRATFIKDFRNRQDLDEYSQKTFAYPKFRHSLSNADNYYLIVKIDGEMVGYAKLKLGERPVQLQKIYLHPAFLGRGIGKALLEESKTVAREAGADKLWLAVEEQNGNAIAFYERTGWETTEEFDFQIGTQTFHFFRMELDL
jgi:ribosomal protein S18 acetylase RimI-like enzyme